jgi:nicotinate-nucleotide pyrophosphorylase (carboxylating)
MAGNSVDGKPLLEQVLRGFLSEDLGYGDITSEALIPAEQRASARLYYREPGVAAGLEEAATLLTMLGCAVKLQARDGAEVKPRQILLEATGTARTLLATERLTLNLVSHMAGIATATAEAVKRAHEANPGVRVAATRKTLPGLRGFEKRAVELGGGDTHRLRLDDCVLIKDNHLSLLLSVSEAIRLAKAKASFTKKIEIEVRTAEQAEEAARAGADIIMFDNMDPPRIREVLGYLASKGLRVGRFFEASGGITLDDVGEYAAAGVDVVSLGCLTHSVRALDVKLEIGMTRGFKA